LDVACKPLPPNTISEFWHFSDIAALANVRFAKSGPSSDVAFDPKATFRNKAPVAGLE
jgi:hypothetical protein